VQHIKCQYTTHYLTQLCSSTNQCELARIYPCLDKYHHRITRQVQSHEANSFQHTHTHTCLTALCPGLPRSAGTREVKPIRILLKQETVSGRGISWAICKSAPCSRQVTICPSCHPANSVKALKVNSFQILGKNSYRNTITQATVDL